MDGKKQGRERGMGQNGPKEPKALGKPVGKLALATSFRPEDLKEAKEPVILRLFEGQSVVAKEHFERDISRLRETLAPGMQPASARGQSPVLTHPLCFHATGRIEPKLELSSDPGRQMAVSVPNLLQLSPLVPESVVRNRPNPIEPEKTLNAAMKKAGHKR